MASPRQPVRTSQKSSLCSGVFPERGAQLSGKEKEERKSRLASHGNRGDRRGQYSRGPASRGHADLHHRVSSPRSTPQIWLSKVRDGCQLVSGARTVNQSIPERPTDEPSRLRRLAVTYSPVHAATVCLKPETSPWYWSLGRMQIFTRVSPACVCPGPCPTLRLDFPPDSIFLPS
ncbi:hypothetical protein LX36DRAFT_453803 [Colletotrichum falcatum]|nr:hypothetical protein LX36DRAFT_453803 [Colletotrichum falcatum]